MIELKDIGERLVSIVSVEHYALGLLKMLEDKSQKEVAQYICVSQSKLSPIIQLLTEIHINKPCVIVRYVKTDTRYYLVTNLYTLPEDEEFIDIFKFSLNTWETIKKDLNINLVIGNFNYLIVDKLPHITIDALHNLEYKHKA